MDTLSPAERSERMSRIRSRDTKPEMAVRRLVHSLGYRYRLHAPDLPGRPDLVFRGKRKVILVHGCYWHRHDGCARNRTPKSRREFWIPKLQRNVIRDREVLSALILHGWSALVVWECEIRDHVQLTQKLIDFLETP